MFFNQTDSIWVDTLDGVRVKYKIYASFKKRK